MGMILNDTFDIFKHNVCFFDNDDPVNFLFMSDNVFSRIENELEAQQKRHEWFCLAIGCRQESYSQNWTNWRNRGFPAKKPALSGFFCACRKKSNVVFDKSNDLFILTPSLHGDAPKTTCRKDAVFF